MKIPQTNHQNNPTNGQQENSAESIQSENGSANVHQVSEMQEKQQKHEEAMFAAIDNLCRAPEQTYEQFLSCFSYYKPDPTEKHYHELAYNANSGSNQVQDPQKRGDHALLDTSVMSDAGHVTEVSHNHDSHCEAHDDEDLLEEQILNTDSALPLVSKDKDFVARPMIKVDNFVDDESINSDPEEYPDINDCEPYVASFAQGNSNDKHLPTNSSTVCNDKKDDYPDPEEEEESKEIPSTGYSKQISRSDINSKTEMKFDSTGQPITDVDSPNPDDSSVETKNGLIQDLLYPGEILEDATSACRSVKEMTHVRQMEYSAKMADGSTAMGHLTETHSKQEGDPPCDEVQPFCLDEDFDYDNVILTPKYSQKDLEELKSNN